MNNPRKEIQELQPCTRIIAKTTNRENNIRNVLNTVCDDNRIQYRYWYSTGLWNVNIYSRELSDKDLNSLEHVFKLGPTDSCMIFLDREELYDDTFFAHYNSLEHQLFDVRPVEPPHGTIFNLKFPDNI